MRTNEETVSGFLRAAYTDEKLAALLAHAEDGKLAFFSCCCFAGVATATHTLRDEQMMPYELTDSYEKGHDEPPGYPWFAMSNAFYGLAESDELRRVKLIPLIHAEMARRDVEKSVESNSLSPVYAV